MSNIDTTSQRPLGFAARLKPFRDRFRAFARPNPGLEPPFTIPNAPDPKTDGPVDDPGPKPPTTPPPIQTGEPNWIPKSRHHVRAFARPDPRIDPPFTIPNTPDLKTDGPMDDPGSKPPTMPPPIHTGELNWISKAGDPLSDSPPPVQTAEPNWISKPDDPLSDSPRDGASIASSRSPSRLRRQVSNLSRHSIGSIRHASLFGPALAPVEREMQPSLSESASISAQRAAMSPESGATRPTEPRSTSKSVSEVESPRPISEPAPEPEFTQPAVLQTETLPAVTTAPKPDAQVEIQPPTVRTPPKESSPKPSNSVKVPSSTTTPAPEPAESQAPGNQYLSSNPGLRLQNESSLGSSPTPSGLSQLSPAASGTGHFEPIIEPETKGVHGTLGLKDWGSSTTGPSMFAGYERLPGNSKKGEGKDGHDNFFRNVSKQATESVSQQPRPIHGINILCIDGGGVRGLSSLLLLREVMNRVQSLEGEPVKPTDWFDVIAGTGTGGVSACMLGKLGMSVEEAIESYTKLTETIFANKKKSGISSGAAYKSTALKESLQEIIKITTGDGSAKMTAGAYRLIFATLKDHMNASIPVIFRSYEARANRAPNCAIWEALYATMAHPDFFKSIDIAENSLKYTFVGGELGNSNPLAHVLNEVRELYPGRYVSCIISVGAGYTHTIRIPNSDRQQVSLAMRAMATDSERVAEEMARRFQDTTSVYFRFSVDQGIQDVEADDWEKLCRIGAHTQAYLSKIEVGQDMHEAAKAIYERNNALAVECIDGRVQRTLEPTILKKCPVPTPYYTGRTKEIQAVGSCIVNSTDQQQVCVIYGLGGAGKSQLAFKAIERNHHQWNHIIYVDATSRETIESALRDFARVNLKYLGAVHTITHTDTLLWLQGTQDSWLLFLDGADDLHLDIRPYFPSSYRGSILITTRIEARVGLAKPPESVYHISSMDPEDASSLLLRVVNRRAPCESKTTAEKGAADELVHDFGFLALAIVHAGAYIAHSTGMSISDYRKLFLKKRQATLEKYKSLPESSKFDDYDKTVYTTWNMCYELLEQRGKHQAQELLWLIAFLHHDGITRAIFQRAATNIRLYTPVLPPVGLEKDAYAYLYEYLTRSTTPEDLDEEDNWVENSFIETMGDLAAYSLIEYDKKNAVYTIHVLVQDWARTVVPHEPNISLERAASLLAISISMADEVDPDSHYFRIGLGPHVKRIISESDHLRVNCKKPCYWEVNPNHAVCFADVFRSMELWHEEEELRIMVKVARKKLFGLEHPATLKSTDDLAHNYVNQGQLDRAESLYNEVLEARRTLYRNTHGEEHDDIQASKKYLAYLYQCQGRLSEAVLFWEDVVQGYKISRGGNNPATLACMDSLADVYCRSMQLEKAEVLRREMLSLIPDSDPDKPMCMRKLAEVLEFKEDWGDAELLLVQSQKALNIHWGERHINAIAGQQHLYEFRVRRGSLPP
ncbi:hypothetical protein FRC11_014365, partial [Ceratobasidium sp. 423]